MPRLIDLEKIQRGDHDTLIRVEAKLDGLIADVKIMNDGTTIRITDHELRLKKIESDGAVIGSVSEAWKRFTTLEGQIHDSGVTTNAYRILAGVVGGIVFFILTQIPPWIKLFLK